jgi:hypothetical protein
VTGTIAVYSEASALNEPKQNLVCADDRRRIAS